MRRLAKARWQGLDERQYLDEKNLGTKQATAKEKYKRRLT